MENSESFNTFFYFLDEFIKHSCICLFYDCVVLLHPLWWLFVISVSLFEQIVRLRANSRKVKAMLYVNLYFSTFILSVTCIPYVFHIISILIYFCYYGLHFIWVLFRSFFLLHRYVPTDLSSFFYYNKLRHLVYIYFSWLYCLF